MNVYSRRIFLKLIVARLFFGLILFALWLLLRDFSFRDYAILLAIIIVIFSFVPVTSLTTDEDQITISKYYLFGLVQFTWKFNQSDKIELRAFETELMSDENAPLLISSFFGWITTMMPSPTLKLHRYQISSLNKGRKQMRVKLKLNSEEYYLLRNFIAKCNS